MIKTINLTKYYKGNAVPALKDLSVEVEKGDILGILGPNGAGKTTLISILCGLSKASSGNAIINNLDINKYKHKIIKTIGVVTQDIALYPSLTVMENLVFFGKVYGLKKNETLIKIEETVDVLGLKNHLNKQIRVLSSGMKRRVNIIAGILHQPQLLFLDEPTVGIDVYSKNIIIDYLTKLNGMGTTIVYTSHLLNEAEIFCKSIMIINNGHLVTHNKTNELLNLYNTTNIETLFLKLTSNNSSLHQCE